MESEKENGVRDGFEIWDLNIRKVEMKRDGENFERTNSGVGIEGLVLAMGSR